MKDLYYELTDNGYHIYDRNDVLFHIHQYEPFIPDHESSYEENAILQIHGIMVSEYVCGVAEGRISIDDVPSDYVDEVKLELNNIEDYELAYKIVTGEVA